jgi:uncharacterized protein YfiM (DUF2279 family)
MRAATRVTAVVALVSILSPPGGWFGTDKLKHFLMSALVHSAAFSIARASGAQRSGAQVSGAVSAATIGVWKELHDRRVGKPFSVGDLLWDGMGAASAAALLNRSR